MKKLPSELKKRVNKIAHAAGLDYGEQAKHRLLAEIESRLTAGASIVELGAFLDDMGQRPITGDLTTRQTHHASLELAASVKGCCENPRR